LTKPAPKNLPASVRQKLANLARERNMDFGLILVKYGLERILFRLSRSRHRDVFIFKGALVFKLWTEQRYRPTRDVISSLTVTTPRSRSPIFFGNYAFWKSTRTACASTPRPSKRNAYPRMSLEPLVSVAYLACCLVSGQAERSIRSGSNLEIPD
jgi:hypothetical protein